MNSFEALWALCERLQALTGNEIKVWLAYLRHADKLAGTAYLGNEAAAGETNLNVDTVKSCKRSLIAKNWLAYTGDAKQPRNPSRRFEVPVMQLLVAGEPLSNFDIPAVVEKITHAEGAVVESAVDGNFPPEGYGSGSVSSFEVTVSVNDIDNCDSLPKLENETQTKSKTKTTPDPAKGQSIPSDQKGLDTKVPPPAAPTAKGKPKAAKDGTPYPDGFDKWGVDRTGTNWGWGNAARTCWLMIHDPNSGLSDLDIHGEVVRLREEDSDIRVRKASDEQRMAASRSLVAAEFIWQLVQKEAAAKGLKYYRGKWVSKDSEKARAAA
jgi:hypothetical protein